MTGDRRISGSLASLAGLEAGDPDAPGRILLAHAIVLGFGGVPVLWMGDELGLLNDAGWADEPAHAADNRWVHRPRMPWPTPPDQHGISAGLRDLLEVRRSLPHLHSASPTEIWDPRDPGVLLVVRRHPVGSAARCLQRHRATSGGWTPTCCTGWGCTRRGCTTPSATGSPSSTRARSGSRRTRRRGSSTATLP